jgi:hypothetical protein
MKRVDQAAWILCRKKRLAQAAWILWRKKSRLDQAAWTYGGAREYIKAKQASDWHQALMRQLLQFESVQSDEEREWSIMIPGRAS